MSHSVTSQTQTISIEYKRNDDHSVEFYYNKSVPGSYYLSLEFNQLENSGYSGISRVVSNSKGYLFRLTPINPEKGIGFSYGYYYFRGNPEPKVDSLFTYCLPFKKNKGVDINESSNIGNTYLGFEKPSKWKSYIVFRKSPDTVCAMRKGVVVDLVNDFKTDKSLKYDFKSDMNSILIEHDDGTFASYRGFKQNSFLVTLGQTVYPQTELGTLDMLGEDDYRLYFNIHYTQLKREIEDHLENKKSYSEYLTPYFITTNGKTKLKQHEHYIVDCNETIFLKEFSKREKKKYRKNPELYK
ncbi:hypothetical protein GCM10022260_20300 [Gaetbulibacter aestuarii]